MWCVCELESFLSGVCVNWRVSQVKCVCELESFPSVVCVCVCVCVCVVSFRGGKDRRILDRRRNVCRNTGLPP